MQRLPDVCCRRLALGHCPAVSPSLSAPTSPFIISPLQREKSLRGPEYGSQNYEGTTYYQTLRLQKLS